MKTNPATPRKSRVFTRHDLYRHRSPLDENRDIHFRKTGADASAAGANYFRENERLSGRWRADQNKTANTYVIENQRTQSTYLFGAVCPEQGTGARSCRVNTRDLRGFAGLVFILTSESPQGALGPPLQVVFVFIGKARFNGLERYNRGPFVHRAHTKFSH